MKLVTYRQDEAAYVGVLNTSGTGLFPLPYPDVNTLIETTTLSDLLSAATAAESSGAFIPLSAVTLLAPIPCPRQDILCLGINYKAHAEEASQYDNDAFQKTAPAIPIYFSKRVTQAVEPEGFIESHPDLVERLDYEAELAIIIGKTAQNVKAADVQDYLFGYTVLNDVTARDLQTRHQQWYFGKGLDGFTPMGPCIVTADEIAFPPVLRIFARVNGELRQDSTTDLLITDIPTMVEELSSGMTLLPGTIIATGTPAGVGMGFDPPRFLKSGDVVECTIEGIGSLRNTVR